MSSKITAQSHEQLRLHQAATNIRTREDFVTFARDLATNRSQNPKDWPNHDLATYLEALAAWVEDMDGYYANQGEPMPDVPGWKTFGQILLAAKVYE